MEETMTGSARDLSPTITAVKSGQPDATCPSCFKTAETEPVQVKRDGQWVDSTVRRCANPECHSVREGTLDDRLQHVRSVYGYKYFGDYELSPEQLDAVMEARALAELVPGLLAALKRLTVQMTNLLMVADVPERFADQFNDGQRQAEAAIAKAETGQ